MRCAAHPQVETNLSCGKCGKPICPLCLVETPVGARCRECALLRPLPTYRVGFPHYARAVGLGAGIAIAVGILWGWLWRLLPSYYLNVAMAIAVGFAVGELISLSVNRKRGAGLQVIAGLSVVLSYLFSHIHLLSGILLIRLSFSLYDLIAVGLGVFVAVTRL